MNGNYQVNKFYAQERINAQLKAAESHRLARKDCDLVYDELFPEDGVPKDRCDVHGSPVVEVGRLLGGLFGRKGGPAIEGDGSGEEDPVATP